MLLIRPANVDDVDRLLQISAATGPGMTSMPADRGMWQRRLEQTANSFQTAPSLLGNTYFMVLEDRRTGHIAGSTAIYTGIGSKRPFYSYKVSTLVNHSAALERTVTHKVLHLVNDYTGATEIGSLYLDPNYRHDGNGAFISRARYLLLAGVRERFSNTVIAELRGWQDSRGDSPFWEHLGKKFFGLAFENADYMNAVTGTQFISDLMPRYPIYVDLLPRVAREVIGKPHTDSARALSLLMREGFYFADYVDIFDGGPTVQCRTDDIRSVREVRSRPVIGIQFDRTLVDSPQHILSNDDLSNYRIVRQPAAIHTHGIVIGRSTAEILCCEIGSTLSTIGT